MMVEEAWLPQISPVLCTGCGDCVVVCPMDALAVIKGTAVVTNPLACHYCAECETICPTEAIALPYQIVLEISG